MSGEDNVRLAHLIVHSSSSTCSECHFDSLIEATHTRPSGYLQKTGCGAAYRYVTTDMGGEAAAAEATQRIADRLNLPFKNMWGKK